MKLFFLLLSIFISVQTNAQRIYGAVYTDKGDPLPYASITIKGTTIGASANNRAKFSINLKPGKYTLVCQHIGYATREKEVELTAIDEEVVFALPEQKLLMKDVLIKTGGEDPAYAIIRQAIKKHHAYAREVKSFDCDLYTKDLIRIRKLPKKIMGQKIPEADRQGMGLDTSGAGIIYLSESVAKVYTDQPDKFKMEVISSRVSGSNSFGFTFPTFINLYRDNVTIFSEKFNPRGFISPIADGAIHFYKFRFLGSFWENGKEINSIRVIPRRNYEPLFSGIINITDGDWRIHSTDMILTKTSLLEVMDTLRINQIHVPAGEGAWRVKNQLIQFSFNQFGIEAAGNFMNVYSGYRINPAYPKGFFDRVVIRYDTAVNKRPKAYWDTIRPVPLEREEIQDYQVKDSLFELQKDSIRSRQSVDSLRKSQPKVKPFDIFTKGIHRTHYSKSDTYRWGFRALLPKLEYNPAEGAVVNIEPYYEKYLKKSKTNLSVSTHLRYGFSNTHFNGWVDVQLRTRDWSTDKKLKREAWHFAGGKRVSQFNNESPITPGVNSISTLFYGDNFMKTYENYFGRISFSKRYESGFRFIVGGLYEDRIPLNNTSDFTIFSRDKKNLTPNYPNEKISTQFSRHQALLLDLTMSFRPGQRFIQFPASKVPIGSKYPTLTLQFVKGIKGVLGSDVDFDKWKFTIHDDKNFKLAGMLKYKIGVGGFLSSRSVPIQDYQHFNGNLAVSASEYVNSFQLAPYYANSNTERIFALAHLEHHFNGLLTNKIPFFNRLNWNLVAGTNTFYVNRNNNYVEIFAGIENILKIFRVDVVAAYADGIKGRTGIRIGAGGLIGSSIRMNNNGASGSRTVNIRF